MALSLNFEYLCRGTNSKGEIIILSPYFGPYQGMCKLGGATPILVETDKNFQPDFKAIEKAFNSNTKAILINSPNNPTG